ncbi:MAG: nucleoside monophosphate kinase [Bryobacteraceae bacterium]|nr:nucleoside monophosphate kinase [Bryobacteraceae bacterium]
MKSRYFLPLLAAALLAQPARKPVVVVLIGPPASGKTTQADYLQRKYNIPTISIEDLLAERNSASGDQRPLTRSDSAVGDLVRQRMDALDLSQGFALDGYPSTREQAEHLGALVKEKDLPSPVVIEIRIPDNMVRERCAQRGSSEDAPEIVEQRLADYRRESKMLRDYYADESIWTIDGTREPAGVSATIRMLIENR